MGQDHAGDDEAHGNPSRWRAEVSWRAWGVQTGIGVALGLLLVGTIVVAQWAAGWLVVEGAGPASPMVAVGGGVARAMGVAALEETIFRGVLLAYLQRPLRTAGSIAVSAGAFALVHAWNANVSALAIVNLVLAGGLLGLAYVVGRGLHPPFAVEEAQARRLPALAYVIGRGLALPIGLHAGWNFFEGSVFGLPVSGSTRDSLLSVTIAGPELATGGAFGPEGGLVGSGAMLLTGMVLWAVRDRVPICPPLTAAR